MKAKLLAAVLILSVLFITANKSYAWWDYPIADLKAVPDHVALGNSVILDGNDSYDQDPNGTIVKYEWDFDYNGVTFDPNYWEADANYCPDSNCDGKVTHTYNNVGTYTVMLRVTDNDDNTDTDTCMVYVTDEIFVPDDVNTIQDAIDIATDGIRIVVSEGRYYETIDFKGKEITVTSTDPNDRDVIANTVIRANNESDANVVTFDSNEDANSVLRGFTITGGDRGIYCDGTSPVIMNCIIKNNHSRGDGGGMHCTNSAAPTITNCIFSENSADDKGGGIYCNEANPNITNCIFSENSADDDGGGMYCKDSDPNITNCIFSENLTDDFGGGIRNYNSSPTLVNCTFSGNSAYRGGAMHISGGTSTPNVTNCIFWDNTANYYDEIYTYPSSDPNFSHCCIKGCKPGGNWDRYLGTNGGENIDSDPCFVDMNNPGGSDGIFGTWDDGLRLWVRSPCIDAADGNVAALTDVVGQARIDIPYVDDHNGTGDPNYSDIGAYESLTVWFVDEDANDANNGSSWEDAFTNLQYALDEANDGDHIWVAKGDYIPTDGNDRSIWFALVKDVAVYGGFAGTEVGRHQRDWANKKTTLSGDIGTIGDANDNSYHVVVITADNAILDGFTITGGNASASSGSYAYGGGIYCGSASPTIINCTITDNSCAIDGGGMRITGGYCSPTITNCFFINNFASMYGAGMGIDSSYGSPTVTNCTFSGNTTDWSCGAIITRSSLTLINCTIAGNVALVVGALGCATDDTDVVTVTNCIFWDNNDSSYGQIWGTSPPTLTYCDVEGGYSGTGNIDSDPCFVDANNPSGPDGLFGTWDDGLRLTIDSPCIDAADGNTAPLTDALGLGRIDFRDVNNSGTGSPDYADMGVYESGGDLDGDGMPDEWENKYGLDPNDASDANEDILDSDGHSNLEEYLHGTDPNDSNDPNGPLPNTTIRVPSEVSTIQRAINLSIDGDTIMVSEGRYYENIDFNGKAITLTGTDPNDLYTVDLTIIDGNLTPFTDVVAFENSEEANSVITGFTITGGYYDGIYCERTSPTITNCAIWSNSLNGVKCYASSSPTIANCIISKNGYGVNCDVGSLSDISTCTIKDNSGGGVLCGQNSGVVIDDCIISNNGYSGISLGTGSSPSTIKKCKIVKHQDGVSCGYNSQASITNCIISDNTGYGIYCGSSSSVTVTNCTIVGTPGTNAVGIYGSSTEVKNCILWDNDDDLFGCSATYSCIKDNDLGLGNIHDNPMFVDANGGDYHLYSSTESWSPCIDRGDPCSDWSNEPNGGGGRINMGAYGNTSEAAFCSRVDWDGDGIPDPWEKTYWPNDDPNEHDPNDDDDGDGLKNIVEYRVGWSPIVDDTNSIPGYVLNERTDLKYPAISPAIDYAINGDRLIADPARFCESIHFQGKEITITSTDPNNPNIVNATIIDGNSNSTNVVTFAYGEDANSVLTGFTITGGQRGIYCSGTSPIITNCIVTDNEVEGADGPGLYCGNSASPTVSNCIFSWNTCYGADQWGGAAGGIYCSGASLTVTNSIIMDNEADVGGGIYCQNSNVTVKSCIIIYNEAGDGGGIYNYGSTLLVTNCIVTGNYATDWGGGMYNNYFNPPASNPKVINSIFWDNTAGYGNNEIYNYSADPNFSYCDIKDSNGTGPYWDSSLGTDGGGNIDTDPCFIDLENPQGLDGVFGTFDDGLRILAFSPCVDAGNGSSAPESDITGQTRVDVCYIDNDGTGEPNYADIGAYESVTVWFVDANAGGDNNGTSWDNAFTNLQDALDTASDGNQIWVAEGTYKPTSTNDRSISFELVAGVGLYGGFANTSRHQQGWAAYESLIHETILSGDINEPNDTTDNSYHVVIGADGAVLDGFIITGGNANGSGINSDGAGIYCDQSSPAIRKCVIFENVAANNGGGIYCNDSNLVVTSCIITNNDANCGGGMYNVDSSPLATNCTFTNNYAYAYGGGIYDGNSDIEIKNSIIGYNTAVTDGNNIHNNSSTPDISYSDIEGCYMIVIVDPNFIWDPNLGKDPNVWAPNSLEDPNCIDPNIVWDSNLGTDGGGNIASDPAFRDYNDPAGPDGIFGTWDDGLRLMPSSPCIDAADGNTAPLADIIGFGRYDVITVSNMGGGIPDYADIGAYESHSGWDADGDAMQDDWEILYGLDPNNPDDADGGDPNNSDPDGDSFPNIWEYLNESNPLDPCSIPDYSSGGSLPYHTSFEYSEGYSWVLDPCMNYIPYSIDGQKNWSVSEGVGAIGMFYANCIYYPKPDGYSYVCDPCLVHQAAVVYPGSTVLGIFNDTGSNHNYVRLRLWTYCRAYTPWDCLCESEVLIKYGPNIIAAVRFTGTTNNFYIQVWDGSGYVDSQTQWSSGWPELKFEMNWGAKTYNVYWGGSSEPIYSNAAFGHDCSRLTTVELKGNYSFLTVDSLSINNESTTGGMCSGFDIETPCACSDDELEGRVKVTGSVWSDHLVGYEIRYCPVDPDIDRFDGSNWYVADGYWASGMVDGFLGYWDTSSLPNGYYYLGIRPYWDITHLETGPVADSNICAVEKVIMIGQETAYSGPGYFSVVGDLKCNTFYYEEEPDISVPWPGQFPFELKRVYNNNRRFYDKPLRNGWTQNNQVTLIEDSTYDWEPIEGTQHQYPGYPAGDVKQIAFGHVWITYPDGRTKLFRHTDGYYNAGGGQYAYVGDAIYYPYPESDTGEYIVRTTSVDVADPYELEWMQYDLYLRDGTVLVFKTGDLTALDIGTVGEITTDTGVLFGRIVAPLDNMSDRYGNTLNYAWKKYESIQEDPWRCTSAVTTEVKYTRADGNEIGIVLELDGSDEYYTAAELRFGDIDSTDANDYEICRTVEYEWDDVNDVYKVIKSGYGVDANGIYDPCNIKEYVTQYQYDVNVGGLYLVKVAYDEDINNPSIEVEYDYYGRVGLRKDYVDPNDYLTTTFDYTFYHPNSSNISYLLTDVNFVEADVNTYRMVSTIQNENGAVLERHVVTSDSSAAIDVNSEYTYGDDPLKPTTVYEYFDGVVRKTENSYGNYGTLTERKVYVDDSNYAATEMTYHPDYELVTNKIGWQGLNKSGQQVQTVYVYGEANGVENANGLYLVKEKVLLAEDPNVWAETKYVYYGNGRVKKKEDPNGLITFYEYDSGNYVKFVRMGTSDSNELVQRFYYDPIGQLRLKANHLGGVTLNDYDDFGRLWKVRTYDNPDALAIPDVNFVPEDYEAKDPCSTVIYGYDERGSRTYEQKAMGGEVLTDYTTSGLVASVTYDDDSYVEYTYNSRGLKTYEDFNDANTGRDWFVQYAYDSMDRLIDTWWYDYDDTTVVKHTSSAYWGTGKKRHDHVYSNGDVLEKQTDYQYDILDRLSSIVVDPCNLALTTSYGYDAAGNRTSTTDPNGNVIYFDYDNANRKIRDYFAAASGTPKGSANAKKDIAYYENNLVKDINSYDYGGDLLARSEFEYDARRRITKVTQYIDDVNTAVTVYDYNDGGFIVDSNEYQVRITDANDKETYIALDAFGRRFETLYPSGDCEQLEYNGDGTLKAKAVFDTSDVKQWIGYFHDGYGRLVDVNYPDGGNVNYSYDGFGRKRSVTDSRDVNDNIGGTGQIAYDYDVLDRIVSVTDQNDYEIAYAYTTDGQKKSITVKNPADSNIYLVEYYYDTAGRLTNVNEPLLGNDNYIVQFQYDDNGNRSQLKYFLTGRTSSDTVAVDYIYNLDNLLTGFSATGGPTFMLNGVTVDGLGRLTDANETITKTDGNTVDHSYNYQYDMLSQLTDANIGNIGGNSWVANYVYKKNGDMVSRTIQENTATFSYYGHLMTDANGITLNWDDNGNMLNLPYDAADIDLVYNWDNKLRYGEYGSDSIWLKYDPLGNRIWKNSSQTGTRRYIVDITGDLPVILLEIDTSDNSITKTYIYANSQIIAQHDGSYSANKYFYLHDRLGSVRQIIDSSAAVKNTYTYKPFGRVFATETEENVSNPFRFTGQWFDDEIGHYYLRARMYDPYIGRFTSRDPVKGKFKEPMTLHKYLYCLNDPINKTDLTGEIVLALPITMGIRADITGRQLVGAGLAIGFAWQLMMANEARNAFIQALVYKVSDWPPREFPWKDKNVERLIYEHEQRGLGNRPPDDPWGKIIYYLGKILELFHKD